MMPLKVVFIDSFLAKPSDYSLSISRRIKCSSRDVLRIIAGLLVTVSSAAEKNIVLYSKD
jgi:hypothetical protein